MFNILVSLQDNYHPPSEFLINHTFSYADSISNYLFFYNFNKYNYHNFCNFLIKIDFLEYFKFVKLDLALDKLYAIFNLVIDMFFPKIRLNFNSLLFGLILNSIS